MANQPNAPATASKPKVLIVDKKFKPEDLRIPRNQAYVRDLGQCLKIYQAWGFDIIWVDSGIDTMKALKEYHNQIKSVIIEAHVSGGGITVARLLRFAPSSNKACRCLASVLDINSWHSHSVEKPLNCHLVIMERIILCVTCAQVQSKLLAKITTSV